MPYNPPEISDNKDFLEQDKLFKKIQKQVDELYGNELNEFESFNATRNLIGLVETLLDISNTTENEVHHDKLQGHNGI